MVFQYFTWNVCLNIYIVFASNNNKSSDSRADDNTFVLLLAICFTIWAFLSGGKTSKKATHVCGFLQGCHSYVCNEHRVF